VDEARIRMQRERRDALYQDYLRSRDIEIPYVCEVLAELSSRYAMAIVTTAKRADFELIHARRRIVDHMQFVLTNGDYARSKPAPDPYLAALQRFGATPGQAVVIEDSERGLRSAAAAGIDCVVVASPFVAGQNFDLARCRIETLRELPALLDSLA
jgi:HAD superfamily hydrolase (TIGR01509 family)